MAVVKEKKEEIIKDFQEKDGDTGSSFVQIALMTEQIKNMTEHMKKHKKDHHSRRGLMTTINRRNKLLKYVYSRSHEQYRDIVKRLGIRAKYDRHHA